MNDNDNDNLTYWEEVNILGTNPTAIDNPTADCPEGDVDNDDLPNWYERKYCTLTPVSITWMSPDDDPDSDGLTNLEEHNLGSIPTNHQDLFIEIDYLAGYAPTPAVLTYLARYYANLGVYVRIDSDGNYTTGPSQGYDIREDTANQLTAAGVNDPNALSAANSSTIETNFHDNHATHLYVFYANSDDTQAEAIYRPLGWSRGDFGAFIFKQTIIDASQHPWVQLNPVNVENVVFLHELGHCLNIVRYENDPMYPNGPRDANSGDIDGDGRQNYDELYCQNDPEQGFSHADCIMAQVDAPNAVANPTYCNAHWALHDLTDKRSVDGEFGIYQDVFSILYGGW